MSQDGIELSRRKVLAGLGTVGVASSAAGYGTFAALNDSESQNTTFTAGELDLEVTYQATYNQTRVVGPDGLDNNSSGVEISSQEGGVSLELTDVKPGDLGTFSFEVSSTEASNPAWVLSCIRLSNDNDARNTEPEREADGEQDSIDENSDGELDENILAIGFYDSKTDSDFFDQGQSSDDKTYSATADPDNVPSAFFANSESGYAPMTLREFADSALTQGTGGDEIGSDVGPYNGCIILNGQQNGNQNQQNLGNGNLAPLPGNNDFEYNGTTISADEDATINFGYDWHLPYGVGNEVQGDTLTVDFLFYAVQARHTGLPDMPDMFENDEGSGEATTTPN